MKPPSIAVTFTSALVDTAKELNGHFLIAENAGYELYLKKEVMSVIVRDKETGATMESTVAEDDGKSNPSWAGFMKCGINLDVQVGNTTQQKKVDLISGKAEVNVTAIDGGFTASTFPALTAASVLWDAFLRSTVGSMVSSPPRLTAAMIMIRRTTSAGTAINSIFLCSFNLFKAGSPPLWQQLSRNRSPASKVHKR